MLLVCQRLGDDRGYLHAEGVVDLGGHGDGLLLLCALGVAIDPSLLVGGDMRLLCLFLHQLLPSRVYAHFKLTKLLLVIPLDFVYPLNALLADLSYFVLNHLAELLGLLILLQELRSVT